MAKRFTDTGKWAKAGFSELSIKMKLIWIYLCDNCDHAGVWDINMNLLSFQIGQRTTLPEMTEGFGDKVELRDNKLLIPSFIEFQYGALNPDNRVHQSVLQRLERLAPSMDLTSPLQGDKDKDKEKDKEKEKDKDKDYEEGGLGETKSSSLIDVWNIHCGTLSKARATNADRNRRIKERLKEASIAEWIQVIEKIALSPFCNGSNKTGWRADFDWFLKPETRLKVLEGRYDARAELDPFANFRNKEGA